MTEEYRTPQNRAARRIRLLLWLFVLLMALMLAGFYLPTPYYVERPGSAVELAPIVEVEGGKKDAAGVFMLTTVRMGEATPAWVLYAKLFPDAELIDKDLVLNQGESDEDFTRREQAVMQNSQKIAEAVAFRLAGYEVKIENHGVIVMGTIPGMPAKNIFQVGDIITAVDHHATPEQQALRNYLAKKKVGDTVQITFQRDGEERTVPVTLGELPGEEAHRPGLGISLDNNQVIEVPEEVTITARNIGGPSAGLMFTLEIYNQLRKDLDLTRGYRIAGTGTINADGTVGRIGGINHKVVAADKAGAEIFFAPDDAGSESSNYEEAVATAKRIGTKMKIVPVKTVDDAIAFLTSLPPKRS
ncbi:PDZ domain-containing protein [Brevibacillus sp. SYP-B805]|uniref:SepM family pheromone-processing serine protease n=1 Tax=Brevibacillus sp. SYP-B805 TaxID=1578199 RepID=UPI0013EC4815|nr:SepM family pheromone-processing serine protease [Brevibacillus sp. SYP-B805]NGQ93879.1 PDZ domain-containing protein [Brevibacillus sp. SYP-B805]